MTHLIKKNCYYNPKYLPFEFVKGQTEPLLSDAQERTTTPARPPTIMIITQVAHAVFLLVL